MKKAEFRYLFYSDELFNNFIANAYFGRWRASLLSVAIADDWSTMAKAITSGRKASVRRDGRVPTLIYVLPEVLDAAQKVADARGMKSWEWIEGAMKTALLPRRSSKASRKKDLPE